MPDLGIYRDGFRSWRRSIATAGDDAEARLRVFRNMAAEVAGYVARGLSAADAADELIDIATGNGLVIAFGQEAIETIIAAAFDNPPEVVPDLDEPAKSNGKGAPLSVLSKAKFIRGFCPPDYVVDGMLQRRFLYSLTGKTGHAKTSIALLLAQLVACTDPYPMLGTHRVAKGQVVYFVGENPDDIRMRVIGADAVRNDRPECDSIYFIPGVFDIAAMRGQLDRDLAARGKFDLIIVDTSAAYFLGDEELSNTQMGVHARMLRALTTLPGDPCVLVLCHPIKNATEPSQLLPRGGGAFLNEMDGNLTAWKRDDMIELHYNKIRGPDFEPITFALEPIRTPKLVDSKGRELPTVRAKVISQSEEERTELAAREDEDRVLAARLRVAEADALSFAAAAKMIGWTYADGTPAKSRVQRVVDRLEKAKLVRKERGRWLLTEKGLETARRAALNLTALDEARAVMPDQFQEWRH